MDVKLLKIGGISAIVQILGAVVYFIAVGPYMPAPGAATEEVLTNLAKAPQLALWFGWEGVVLDILMLPVALALYFALREREPAYAVLALGSLIFGHAFVTLNDARFSSISWELAKLYATGSPASQAAALVVMESVEMWIGTGTFFVGGILVGGGYGLFGLAMLPSTVFPRWLGWLGVVGGALMVVGGLLSPFTGAGPTIIFASFFLGFAWIFISGIYLLRMKTAAEPSSPAGSAAA